MREVVVKLTVEDKDELHPEAVIDNTNEGVTSYTQDVLCDRSKHDEVTKFRINRVEFVAAAVTEPYGFVVET